MTALLRGNHLPNNQTPLWHQLRWKWLRIFHVNIFSKFLLNHLHIGRKYSLCMAETSFWHRRDRNCTHLSTTTFINIIQLLHFYQQMAHKQHVDSCNFLKDLVKIALLIFSFRTLFEKHGPANNNNNNTGQLALSMLN